MVRLLWKMKVIVAFVMFVASIIAFISFGMNVSHIVDVFRAGSGFRDFAQAVSYTLEYLATPLILFTLGLIAMFIPRPD